MAVPLYNKKSQSMSVYKRRATKPINVGDVKVGGDSPITVQSMTKTDTRDISATARPVSYTHLTLPTILLV